MVTARAGNNMMDTCDMVAFEIVDCPICDEEREITLTLKCTSDASVKAYYECEQCGCTYDEESRELA